MLTVKDLMQEKATKETWSVEPTATVMDALKVMSEKNVGAVVVIDRSQMIGIFSERDFARGSVVRGKCSMETQLKDLMTKEMIIVHPETTVDECMELMTKMHIRHLPVMDSGRLVGMISIGDVVSALLWNKESVISQLQNYILGEGYGR